MQIPGFQKAQDGNYLAFLQMYGGQPIPQLFKPEEGAGAVGAGEPREPTESQESGEEELEEEEEDDESKE